MTKAAVHPMDLSFYLRVFGVLMIGALVGGDGRPLQRRHRAARARHAAPELTWGTGAHHRDTKDTENVEGTSVLSVSP